MAVLRLGYVHARVTDLAEAKQHDANTLGLYCTQERDGKLYFTGWDEWDHHSLVLEEGGVGVKCFGVKVWDPAEIDIYENRARALGYPVERMSAGENAEVSDGIRVMVPMGHVVELYHSMTPVGLEVGTHNPDAFPRHLVGIGAPVLDHALMMGDDVEGTQRFFTDVLDFYVTEQVVASLDDGAPVIASWLSAHNKVHDIALLKGPDSKLHHFAFQRRTGARSCTPPTSSRWTTCRSTWAPPGTASPAARRSTSSTLPATATRPSPAATPRTVTGPSSRGRRTSSRRGSSTTPESSRTPSPTCTPDRHLRHAIRRPPTRGAPDRRVGGRSALDQGAPHGSLGAVGLAYVRVTPAAIVVGRCHARYWPGLNSRSRSSSTTTRRVSVATSSIHVQPSE
jgi:catechol 2,3-dioxygenase